ncbi:hypothetical protein [Pedococcus bigeumensis]|uniref:hypothetical protein n=1 Tax=Pedococcus bigeumensis TaxID=433644 RepID=UPI002FE7F7CC
MRARLAAGLAATALTGSVVAAIGAGAGSASAYDRSPRQDGLAAARAATAKYHDIRKATDFTELDDAAGIACIDNPAGGMGVHLVNGSRLDSVLDPALPEALVYEPQADGSMKLGALEYVILASDWKDPGAPKLFGQSFEYQPGPGEANQNRFGLPAFWELHLWVWNENPRGIFDDWNPKVSCTNA